MATKPKRATIYFDPDVHRALRLRSAETEQSMSDVVNEAMHALLLEDADDLAAVKDRAAEKTVSYASFVADLKKRGRI